MNTSTGDTPDPPHPFSPQTEVVPAGTSVHRCHQLSYRPGESNPGPNGAGRFHFFASRDVPAADVPALYFAQTPTAALCETILRYTPEGAPSRLAPASYRNKAISELTLGRDLKMAMFHSEGLRTLDIMSGQLTDTTSDNYPQTRKWAEAAYGEGFDGLAWMSHQLNGRSSWMVFGDRVQEPDLEVTGMLPLVAGNGFNWMVNVCAEMNVEVIPPFGP